MVVANTWEAIGVNLLDFPNPNLVIQTKVDGQIFSPEKNNSNYIICVIILGPKMFLIFLNDVITFGFVFVLMIFADLIT
jgi:hypothetical protein